LLDDFVWKPPDDVHIRVACGLCRADWDTCQIRSRRNLDEG
jgi:hypothetical protein